MHSRWYTPDFNKVTIGSEHFVPVWHQGLYPSTEEISVKCVVRRIQLALCQCLLGTAYQTGVSLGVQWDTNRWALYCQPDLWLVTVLWVKQFAEDIDILQKLDTNVLYEDTSLGATVGQTLKCQWSLHGSLVCTMCCHYAIHIHQNQYTVPSLIWFVNLFFLNPFVRGDQSKFFLIK